MWTIINIIVERWWIIHSTLHVDYEDRCWANDYLGKWNASVISCIWAVVMPSGSKPMARALR